MIDALSAMAAAPASALGTLAQIVNEDGDLSARVQVVAVIVTVLLLLLVIELVRRRRLVERYALLWMVAAVALVVLAVWRGGLNVVAEGALGVADPVNGIFLIAFAVVFGLLLHFSVAISRLSEETKILAQEAARLEAEVRRLRAADQERDPAPSSASTADQ